MLPVDLSPPFPGVKYGPHEFTSLFIRVHVLLPRGRGAWDKFFNALHNGQMFSSLIFLYRFISLFEYSCLMVNSKKCLRSDNVLLFSHVDFNSVFCQFMPNSLFRLDFKQAHKYNQHCIHRHLLSRSASILGLVCSCSFEHKGC